MRLCSYGGYRLDKARYPLFEAPPFLENVMKYEPLTQRSNVEEIIGILWIIAALLAFSDGHRFWGWVFLSKGVFDCACAIVIALIYKLSHRK
jgi:hypothetical protein